MILVAHSNAGYNNEPEAKSRVGDHFFLASYNNILNNGSIHNVAQILKAVSLAAEAELGGLFINARKAVHIRNILTEMGHPYHPSPYKLTMLHPMG